MIYLEQNTNNTVILQLTQNSNLINPDYLFQFTNDISLSDLFFTGIDNSSYKCKYNSFDITTTGSTNVNLTGSTINISPGSYTYTIYESTGLTSSNLAISATTGCVIAKGKVIVVGDNPSLSSIYQ
jgi:hypothetical protein